MSALFKKLNWSTQSTVHVLNAPEAFDAELARFVGPTIRKSLGAKQSSEFALAFAKTQTELDRWSRSLAAACPGDAIVWIAYPKGTSKNFKCEFNRDTGWTVLGKAGFEPVRQVAIDEDWSALRFRRVEYIKKLTRRSSMALSKEGKRRTTKK